MGLPRPTPLSPAVPVTPETRDRFDRLLEQVLKSLPESVHELLDRVPLHVEDYPARQVLEEMGIEYRDDLCGIYSGIPLPHRSVEHTHPLPDVVTIYREGILRAAQDRRGRVTADRIREEIRKTVLHELGHHFGMTEDDLRQLGYG